MTPQMPATPRPKACNACADSKRRCDKQLPECQRCLDRDVDCVYPQRKRGRNRITRHSQAGVAIENHADAMRTSLDFGDWTLADLDVVVPDVISYLPEPASSRAAQAVIESSISTPCPWFLQKETWELRHCNQDPACVTFVELEPFIRIVDDMMQCWIRKGHNSFIHHRLYEKGMPTCLQDAFTTLVAYKNRTAAVKETILQIAEERSSALVHESPPNTGSEGILDQLARVQALFVYEFIRLFDGSVRLRVSAEKQLPTLRQWVIRMWDAAKHYRGDGHQPLQWNATAFDVEFDLCSEMWRQWVLTESVRRTQLIIDVTLSVYQTMATGWAECAGAVMFTARQGLWEAESAVKWFDLCSAKPPYLVPSLQPGALISEHSAEEFDDFAKMLWGFIVGTDKIQCWIDRSKKLRSP